MLTDRRGIFLIPLAVRSRGLRSNDIRGGDPKSRADNVEEVDFMSVTDRGDDTTFLVCTDEAKESIHLTCNLNRGWCMFCIQKMERSSLVMITVSKAASGTSCA